MGTAGQLSFTFFRLQRTGPGAWESDRGVQGRGFPGHPIPSIALWGQDCPFHLSPRTLCEPPLEPCDQRPSSEGRLVKLENLLFTFILSLCLGLEIALPVSKALVPVSKALLAQSSQAGRGLRL